MVGLSVFPCSPYNDEEVGYIVEHIKNKEIVSMIMDSFDSEITFSDGSYLKIIHFSADGMCFILNCDCGACIVAKMIE